MISNENGWNILILWEDTREVIFPLRKLSTEELKQKVSDLDEHLKRKTYLTHKHTESGKGRNPGEGNKHAKMVYRQYDITMDRTREVIITTCDNPEERIWVDFSNPESLAQ